MSNQIDLQSLSTLLPFPSRYVTRILKSSDPHYIVEKLTIELQHYYTTVLQILESNGHFNRTQVNMALAHKLDKLLDSDKFMDIR